jgi:hypothetical protein
MNWTSGVRSSSLCVQTGSGAHPASYTMGTGGSFPGVKRGRGVMLTTHSLLVPRLRNSRSCTSCHPDAPLWSVAGPLLLPVHELGTLRQGNRYINTENATSHLLLVYGCNRHVEFLRRMLTTLSVCRRRMREVLTT